MVNFFENFREIFSTDPAGVLELRQRVRPDGAAPFSAPAERGARTAAGGFAPNGAAPFLHRKAGARELPQACSPFPGGKFFAEPQRGIRRLRTAGATPYPRRWAKRKGHLRFPFLFELLPFPFLLIWHRFPICDRFENRGTAEDFFYRRGAQCAPMPKPIRSARYRSATQAGEPAQARHSSAAQLFGTL